MRIDLYSFINSHHFDTIAVVPELDWHMMASEGVES